MLTAGPAPRTLDEHLASARAIARLMFFFRGNLGFWGQVITARGTFNERAGRYVREHNELKYSSRASYCSFADMRRHVQSILARITP